jgi:histidinol dehydrogenase
LHSNEESEYSNQSSQDSTTSTEDSHNKVEEEVWERIQNEAIERHEQEWDALVQKYEQSGDSHEVASVKVSNSLIPTYRKDLREVLLENLKLILEYLGEGQVFYNLQKNSTAVFFLVGF